MNETLPQRTTWQLHIRFIWQKKQTTETGQLYKMQLNRHKFRRMGLMRDIEFNIDSSFVCALFVWTLAYKIQSISWQSIFISFSFFGNRFRNVSVCVLCMLLYVFTESKAYLFMMLVCNNLIWYAGPGVKYVRDSDIKLFHAINCKCFLLLGQNEAVKQVRSFICNRVVAYIQFIDCQLSMVAREQHSAGIVCLFSSGYRERVIKSWWAVCVC